MYKFFFPILIFIMVTASSCTASASNSEKVLPPEEFATAVEIQNPLNLIDVRTPEEYAAGHIPGAINIDVEAPGFVDKVAERFPSGSNIYLYCRSGRRSTDASKLLEEKGYDVTDLQDGILAWQKSELPLTVGKSDIYLTPGGKTIEIEPLIHASIRITFDGREIEIDPVHKMGDRVTDYPSAVTTAAISASASAFTPTLTPSSWTWPR